MGYREYSDCVFCERCVNCGRKHAIEWYCDKCNDSTDDLYDNGDGQLCRECFLEDYTSKECDDMDDTRCAECGDEAEVMYDDDGEWLCEYCLLERYRVDTSEVD